MTIIEIVTKVYECNLCDHRWSNQINGRKYKGIPQRCAKCKRYGWNGEESFSLYKAMRLLGRHPISPKENGLRRRIRILPRLYLEEYEYFHHIIGGKESTLENSFDLELLERFLLLNPRPALEELKSILHPKGEPRLTSKNRYKIRGLCP